MVNRSFLKKLGVTVSLGAAFGLVAAGTAISVDTLQKTSVSAPAAVTAEAADQGITLTGTTLSETDDPEVKTAVDEDTDKDLSVEEIAELDMPSLVAITNTSVTELQDFYGSYGFFMGGMGNGRGQSYESVSKGTGVIIGETDDAILIATNQHVIADANTLSVAFVDETAADAVVLGESADTDLAVISVSKDSLSEDTLNAIRVVSIGSSDALKIGEQVVAIGNALGYGHSVTTGIVSALGREVAVRDTYGYSEYEELIQTDAAINAGNSGGALLNMNGEVIGINSIKASANGVEGMGYAIPTAKALPIIQRLMNRETSEKVSEDDMPYIGITGENVDESVSQLYGLPVGIYLSEVSEDSPADEAGLRKGMIMTAFDGENIKTMADLQKMLEYYAAGETVTVTVQKADENGEIQEQEISLTLGRRADYIRMN
jgi:serine protease Do